MSPFDKLHNKRHDFQIPMAVHGDKSRLINNGMEMIGGHKYLEPSKFKKNFTRNARNVSSINDNMMRVNGQLSNITSNMNYGKQHGNLSFVDRNIQLHGARHGIGYTDMKHKPTFLV